MATFSSSVGLITGINIAETVDQLMSLASRPRDTLATRVAGLQEQQVAVGELTALSIGLQLSVKRLASARVFQQVKTTSSNDTLLAATVTGTPATGTYSFTPVRTAQSHQLISGGVASSDQALGGGAFKLRFGGFLDQGLDLELLNGGAGVERGKIRITDRSGASAVIDLRFAVTVDDVLDRINANDDINVTALADGDAIRLVDETGLAITNLKVQEVNGGSTAADLGLAGIDVAASGATGQDLVRLFNQLEVGQLNDGNGLSIRNELPDLEVRFRDGSTLEVDLTRDDVSTVGDLLDALNAADPDRLQAALSADGKRLVLTDLTADAGGTFAVSSALGGTLAEDLGLTGSATGGVLTGGRLLSGLKSPLLRSLHGGQGLGTLGQISLTDRSGASATVDLAGTETLGDVVERLNASGLGLTVSVNSARNGIVVQDQTGATAGNLVIANADATNTADQLGLTFDGAADSVNSGSLDLQVFHEHMRLDALRNGQGVRTGSFTIVDTMGKTGAVNLRTSTVETVGDVLELINGLGIAVEARINDTGDGILLVDTARGGGTLTVIDTGNGKAAADLGLAGTAQVVDVGGTPTQVIDGTTTTTITFDAEATLADVARQINERELGVTASVFESGSGVTPFRLVLSSGVPGTRGAMLLDGAELGLTFRELSPARDAVLMVGAADIPGAGILATSSTNRFSKVVEGLDLTVAGSSDEPVTIDVQSTDDSLVSNARLLVTQYNKLRDKIDELTYFNARSEETGILFGSREVLQIESQLSRLFTGRTYGLGAIGSLEQLGLSLDGEGQLKLDETRLQAAFASDPDAVQRYFLDEESGFAARLDAVIESIAGEGQSLLVTRNDTLQRIIDAQNDRIAFFDAKLERQREHYLSYYYKLELAVAKIQSNLSIVEGIKPMELFIGRSRRG
ncbi:MAG: flagellar filament capping protein FliD [Planctomycetaceae bacterium]|nr:flagellar filament capping protein FliD [Planctomycetaceae bacterium]